MLPTIPTFEGTNFLSSMLQQLHLHCPMAGKYGYIMLSAAIRVLKENVHVHCGSFHTLHFTNFQPIQPGLFVSEMLELAWAQKSPLKRIQHVGNCCRLRLFRFLTGAPEHTGLGLQIAGLQCYRKPKWQTENRMDTRTGVFFSILRPNNTKYRTRKKGSVRWQNKVTQMFPFPRIRNIIAPRMVGKIHVPLCSYFGTRVYHHRQEDFEAPDIWDKKRLRFCGYFSCSQIAGMTLSSGASHSQ